MSYRIARSTLALTIIIITFAPSCDAQITDETSSSAGKKFAVGFPTSFGQGADELFLFITNPKSSVNFTVTPINISGNISNSSTRVNVPSSFEVLSVDERNKGIFVEADGNISVYGLSFHSGSADAYLALPCSIMAVDEYEYYGISYDTISSVYPSAILLVACENETVVKFISSTITLNSMETYQIESDNDLTGTRITSSKPLSVFSGSDCILVPPGIGGCDHVVEQVPPTVTWGSKFLVASLEGRSSGERIRVLSARAANVVVNCNTVVSVSQFQLQSGGSFREFEIPINSFCSIESTSPVLVTQYAYGRDSDGMGDPFMMMIPPIEQYTNNYLVKAFLLFVSNYVTVYVPSEFFQTAQILLDNSIVTGWRNVVCSSGDICGHISRTNVSTGAHSIRHQNSSAVLGVSVYGFNAFNSYGYPGGMRLSPIQCNCGQNSICLNNMGQFNCSCLNGFVASLSRTGEVVCNIVVQCEAERDSVWGLVFPATVAGFSYSQQCPQNENGKTLGTANRFCTLSGVWEAVNIDKCTSLREVFISLLDRANELFSRNASQSEVDDLLVSLAEATSVNATGDSTIFPQGLSITNTIVKSSVNYLVQNVETASPMSSLNFSEEVMNVLNNVLDERNTEGWERLQEDSAAESQQLLLSAELYGQYVSLALRSKAVDTGNVTEITLVRQNIVLAAIEVDTTSLDDIIFPEVIEVSEETGSAQTVIPAAHLMERGALNGNVTAVNILFSNLENFLPKTNFEMNTTRPVSQVISSQVFSNVKLTNSQAQATFRFTTQKFSEDEVAENARCVFWSVSSTWSTEGVITVSVGEDEQMRVYNIVCESSHFTAFSVLMDVTGALNDTTPEIRFALSVVTYVGCSISIFFLFLSILYFLTLRKELLTKVHSFIHLNLSISLLLGYVVFLSGVETAVANKGACVFVAALLHYLFTTVFFWMLCEGIMLYLMLVLVFNQISKKWWIFFIIGWGVPVIPVAISAGIIHDQYGTEKYCWIAVGAGDKGAIWAFVVPMLLVVLVNVFFLLAALRSVYNLRKSTVQQTGIKESLQLFSQLFKTTVILLPILGLTWVFGLLSVNSSTIVFAWLFSIFNSLQGLFVFIFHVLRSEKVTNFLKQCRKRMNSVVLTSASGKNDLSKNPTSGVQLKPSHSRFSKHNHSTMKDEAIKVDETAASEFVSEKSYIAELLENDN
ncbi:adhesion G protein-coupled receptor L3-like isoform X2 [Halichondria panicea]|uniref:adhesion G protein-coupled receptor L3-like isoform X2 n=1 Tax=Halichondria panicea TaxID=6063 RepID=UPI00312BC80B